jgi:hypothetical protein
MKTAAREVELYQSLQRVGDTADYFLRLWGARALEIAARRATAAEVAGRPDQLLFMRLVQAELQRRLSPGSP